MLRNKHHLFRMSLASLFLLLLLAACQGSRLPEQYGQVNSLPRIYPDYADVTIPVNIAPLCFELFNEADEAVVRFSCGADELIVGGMKIRPDIDAWHQLLAKASGQDITVEIYARHDGQWARFQPFALHVSPDSIDPWLSYRLISPSYVSYEELTINQRCLENFDEGVIASNMLCSSEEKGQCINCHSYQNYNPERMQLHARHAHGATLIAYDAQLTTLNSQISNLKSPLVYSAWHPTEKLIAYSQNSTMQTFHTVDIDKIEVYDLESSLCLYDIDRQQLTTIDEPLHEMATYPAWSPDGRWLYYSSAHFVYAADTIDMEEITLRTRDVKYNIYRRPFDPATLQFGERQLVFTADSLFAADDTGEGRQRWGSATLPRISPDGRWLLFTIGEYGSFHIWHNDADLWMMDLKELTNPSPLTTVNSPAADSYHSWSSNGRWIVFSSRRGDGVFTRPFFAHIDDEGRGSKPFELPTADPDLHLQLLKSYNVPEFTTAPVTLTPQQIASKLKSGE